MSDLTDRIRNPSGLPASFTDRAYLDGYEAGFARAKSEAGDENDKLREELVKAGELLDADLVARAVAAEDERDRLREALKDDDEWRESLQKEFARAEHYRIENARLREALAAAETRLFHCSNAVELLRGVEAENDRLREALERVKQELIIPAAEYVPAIPACWDIIDAALAKEGQ
jgi:hypothetical protein